jgi:hypothetical protein
MAHLYTQASAGKPEERLFELIDRLETCCKLHFLDEEGVLDELKFTGALGEGFLEGSLEHQFGYSALSICTNSAVQKVYFFHCADTLLA